jgi:hypothetical protein
MAAVDSSASNHLSLPCLPLKHKLKHKFKLKFKYAKKATPLGITVYAYLWFCTFCVGVVNMFFNATFDSTKEERL